MIRFIWRGWTCWREFKIELSEPNPYWYKGCLGFGPVCIDFWSKGMGRTYQFIGPCKVVQEDAK